MTIYAHEPLSLALGYKQLRVIPPDKGGAPLLKHLLVVSAFPLVPTLFSLFSFSWGLLFTIMSTCIFWLLSLPSIVPSYCKSFLQT